MSQQQKHQVQECTFQMQLMQGTGNIKFPCTCFVQWKTANGKDVSKSSNKVKLVQGKLDFNQKLLLTTYMLVDAKSKIYLKKESVTILSLLSNSRPNQPKLVGRVTVQLSSVANQINFQQLKQYPLQFCSVGATLTFKVSLRECKPTNLGISDLQRSDYIEYEPVLSQRNTTKEDTKSESENNQPLTGVTNRQRTITVQQRINRLKSQNQISKYSSGTYSSRVKRQVNTKKLVQQKPNPKSSIVQIIDKKQQKEQEQHNKGLTVPSLTKNSDQFDSNKILSQQKQQIAVESPLKNDLRPLNGIQQMKRQQIDSETHQQQQIKRLRQQNEYLISCLDIAKMGAESAKKQITQQKDELLNLKIYIRQRNQQIAQSDAQIQQLKQLFAQKDSQIKEISTKNDLQLRQFEAKQRQFLTKIDSLTEIVQSQNRSKQNSPPSLEQMAQVQMLNARIQQLSKIVQDSNYRFQVEQKNHYNSKLQLKEVRDWFRQLQEQSQNLNLQKEHLMSLLDSQKQNSRQRVPNEVVRQMQSKIKQLQSQLQLKDQQLAQAHLFEQALENYKSNENRLVQLLQNVRKELDELQVKYVEQQSHLHQAQEKAKKYAQLLSKAEKQKQINGAASREKNEQVEQNKRKLNDLIKRLKQKQQNLLKIQRQAQLFQQKCKTSQSNTEKYKEKVKALQIQKENEKQKSKLLQRQNRQLKTKYDRDSESSNKQIKRLQGMLQAQAIKRTQLISQIQNKAKSAQSSKNKDLQLKIKKYSQKQKLLKQCLNHLQEQSNKIAAILQQKQDNQDQFLNHNIALTQQNHHLTSKINELSNQCLLLHERNQGLSSELQLLNAYQQQHSQGQISQDNEILQLNKRLIQKNKDLLEQIQQRNQQIVELQTAQAQMKGKQAHQILSSSRQEKERQDYIQKYQEVVEENEKLYVQFQKLNQRYQQELIEFNQASQDKYGALQVQITQKQALLSQLQNRRKEQVLRLQGKISQIEYQLQYYLMQIKQLTENVSLLKSQIKQKQQNLTLANNQINQLSQKLQDVQNKRDQLAFTFCRVNQSQLSKQPNSPSHQSAQKKDHQNLLNSQLQLEISELKSKIDFYQTEIQRLHEKDFMQQKQIIESSERLSRFKQNCEEQQKHILYLQSQLKNWRQRQSAYIQQIQSLQQKEKSLKASYTQLEKEMRQFCIIKQQQEKEVIKLNAQIQSLKDNNIQSQQSTPINKFKHSPRNSQVDLRDVVAEIDGILLRRKQEEQLENALRLVIDNNTRQEQQFERWGKQRALIQQKAKLISKQLQKIKSNIMKTPNRSIAQKSQLTNFLKPAEGVVNDLINLSQHMTELDPYEEQQQFQGDSNNSPR